jgi:hypothetical protein
MISHGIEALVVFAREIHQTYAPHFIQIVLITRRSVSSKCSATSIEPPSTNAPS